MSGPDESGRARRLPVAALAIVALALVVAAACYRPTCVSRFDRHGDRAPPPPTSDCPELANLDPLLAALPVPELERRLLGSGLLPAFAAEQQLRGIRAALDQYRPDKRPCMYKVMLVSSVATAKGMIRDLPGLWGLDRPSAEIAALFRRLPLRHPFTPAQRDDLLAQIEELFIPSLRADSDADREHWRRQYYSLLLTCEVTDDALAELHAQRPHDCLGLAPRPPDGG